MAIEREPGRYAKLDERKLAEEEVTRRAEEARQSEANARTGRYASLDETQRRVAEEDMTRAAKPEQLASEPGREPFNEIDEVEARIAAKEKELDEKVRLGRITASDKVYEMRKFDNQLLVEGNIRDQRRIREEQASTSQQQDRGRGDPCQAQPETSGEKESAAPAHESTRGGEMSEARTARLERLRGIDRSIERESRERDGDGSEPTRNSDGRSR